MAGLWSPFQRFLPVHCFDAATGDKDGAGVALLTCVEVAHPRQEVNIQVNAQLARLRLVLRHLFRPVEQKSHEQYLCNVFSGRCKIITWLHTRRSY